MKEEWQSIFKSTWIKVVLVAIVIIPMVYAGVFLGSMWDPYGNANHMAVAVVNLDETVDYNGTQLHVGEDLVDNLKSNNSMDFHFVTATEAQQGLSDGSYYMTITIPNDFSRNATTLLEPTPKKMTLQYTTNPGTNYIASKMDETAIRTIKENVSANITETYADTLFSQVKILSSGLSDASDGSLQLANGINQTIDGNEKIRSNLVMLANSSLNFEDGAQSLNIGLQSYTDGVVQLESGAKLVDDGMHTLTNNTKILVDGAQQLETGSSTLQSGISDYTKGVDSMANGLGQLSQKGDALNTGVAQLSQGSSALKSGSDDLLNGLQTISSQLTQSMSAENRTKINQLIAQNTSASEGLSLQIQSLYAKITSGSATVDEQNLYALLLTNQQLLEANSQSITELTSGLGTLQQAVDYQVLPGMINLHNGIITIDDGINSTDGLKNGISAYTEGVSKLNSGATTLHHNSTNLVNGSSQLVQGTTYLNAQVPSLNTGINRLADGASTLHQGSEQLMHNNKTLLDGIGKLSSGSSQIASGSSQLANGSQTLGIGLQQVKDGSTTLTSALEDGATQSKIDATDQTKAMFAQPLDLEKSELSTVENNGKAMAPYMMSVGLYVACMAFTLMYPLLKNNSHTTSGFKLWLSKASVMYVISTAMALVMATALIFINGLSPYQTIQTYLMAMLISAAFMSMIVFFNITCGKIGAFLVLIFMVFQLGGAAGTYPIETSGAFYNMIHPFMPFTYSVDAFRHTLALGGALSGDVFVFVSMIIGFASLSIGFYTWKASISEEQFAKTKIAQFH